MKTEKPSRRKIAAHKLEPIDWHEFANDAVLNGNMSTLYRRPAAEDPSAYASAEALLEIEKRVGPGTGGGRPTVGPSDLGLTVAPTVGLKPPVGVAQKNGDLPFEEAKPTEGLAPTVGRARPPRARVRQIRDVQDALTLAGHVLYKAMYGPPDG